MNRLNQLYQDLATLKGENGMQDNPGNGSATLSYSTPFGSIHYRVPYTKGIGIKQIKNGCWATVAAMMINWKNRRSETVESVMASLSSEYLNLYKSKTGLLSSQKEDFLETAGLEWEQPQSLSIEGWEELLRNYGPIWVTTDENPTAKFSIHARLLVEIKGDGTAKGTRMSFIDPGHGREDRESVAHFIRKYESEAVAGRPLRIQIVHLKEMQSEDAYSEASGYSEAMYGTGEHVLAGEKLYPNMLSVNGVDFTYAELIAMGDLYDTYKDMISASQSELKKLQRLIQRSRKYYTARIAGKKPGVRNPSTGHWQKATKGRYLDLAKENFAHFAPSSSAFTPGISSKKTNHKAEWQHYHKMAINHARQGTLQDLEEALVMNAFGDHFLTDAFAAGHFFNKDDVNQVFKSKLLSGKGLSAAGDKFVEKVAQKAFTGAVKKEFSNYEVTDPHGVQILFWTWNPNIDTTKMFYRLLKKIVEKEPDTFGKTVVAKAIHDHLNDNPVLVENGFGTRWMATGDGNLDQPNLDIMRKAVNQSISNVLNSTKSNASLTSNFQTVWEFVPRPTAQAQRTIKGLINSFTNPTSQALIDKAVSMIKQNYKTIIRELVKRKILQKD